MDICVVFSLKSHFPKEEVKGRGRGACGWKERYLHFTPQFALCEAVFLAPRGCEAKMVLHTHYPRSDSNVAIIPFRTG